MVLGAITGVPTPACLSAASNPVEAVTPPIWKLAMTCCGNSKNCIQYSSGQPGVRRKRHAASEMGYSGAHVQPPVEVIGSRQHRGFTPDGAAAGPPVGF